jgi:hypothetical protein
LKSSNRINLPRFFGGLLIVAWITIRPDMALPCSILILIGHCADSLVAHRAHYNSHILIICIGTVVALVLTMLQAENLHQKQVPLLEDRFMAVESKTHPSDVIIPLDLCK